MSLRGVDLLSPRPGPGSQRRAPNPARRNPRRPRHGHTLYDALNRLTLADLPGTADDRSYQYDAVGNRKVETIGGQARHYVYTSGNRLRDIRLGNPHGPIQYRFVHDANGAITEKLDATGERVWRLDRNDRGQVMRLLAPGNVENFGYDPRSLRVRRSGSGGTFRFHLDGDGLESVYDATGNLRADYLRGVVIDEVVHGFLEEDPETGGGGEGPLVPVTFHHDQVTSVVGLSGHTGQVEQRRVYAPFGETLSETGSLPNELAYTGRERDPATGLYYVRARWYDPEIGRFLREDPLGFLGGSVNLYAYAANNPLRFNDPTGAILDIALDAGFILADIGFIVKDGPTASNLTALGLDIAAAALPFVTGAGPAFRAGNAAVNGGDTVRRFVRNDEFARIDDALLRGDSAVEVGRFFTPDNISDAGGAASQLSLPGTSRNPLVGFFDVPRSNLPSEPLSTFGPSLVQPNFNRLGFGTELEVGQAFTAGRNSFDISTSGMSLFELGVMRESLSGFGTGLNLGNEFGSQIGAGGGFVLFPSKTNTNQIMSVYSK